MKILTYAGDRLVSTFLRGELSGALPAALPLYLRKSYAFPSCNCYFPAAIPPHKRLPIFQTDSIKEIVCNAFDEARRSAGMLIFAYVIMPDHTHVITDSTREMADGLRFLNGISAKRLIDHLKDNGHIISLAKLRIQQRENKHKHSVYEHHPNALRITGEDSLMQKVNYIHLNPFRAGLVQHPDEYLYSSSRMWHGKAIENEPLITDHQQIDWRRAA